MKKQIFISIIAAFCFEACFSAASVAGTSPFKSFLATENVFANNTVSSAISTSPTDESDAKFVLYVSQGILNIKYSKPQDLVNGEVIIFNLLGQEIVRKKLESTNLNQINLPAQNTCFIVRINYLGKVYTKKIIATNN